jgi:hypothetical protein
MAPQPFHIFFGNNTKKLPRRSSAFKEHQCRGTKESSMELVSKPSSIHFAGAVSKWSIFNKQSVSTSTPHKERWGFPRLVLISVGIKELRGEKRFSLSLRRERGWQKKILPASGFDLFVLRLGVSFLQMKQLCRRRASRENERGGRIYFTLLCSATLAALDAMPLIFAPLNKE